MATPDALLLERWQRRRDADAFAELVHRHSGMVFACCKRILGEPTRAEDVAQECFVALMQTREQVRASLAAWLHRIAVRRSIDRLRSETRRRKRETTFAESQQIKSETDIAQSEILARVDEAIAELPDEYKSVIIGRFLENRTHADLAGEFGVAESTLRHRIKKGVDHIRESLHKQGIAAALATIFAALEQTAEAAPPDLITRLNKISLTGSVAAPATAIGLSLWIKAGVAALVTTLIGAGLFSLSTTPETKLGVAAATDIRVSSKDEQASMNQNRIANLAAASTSQPPSTSVPTAKTAESQEPFSIEGRVYDAATGNGLEGMRLALLGERARKDKVEATTDSDGHYQFPPQPNGTYLIIFVDKRFVRGERKQRVKLQDSAPLSGVDFPVLEGYRIAGTVVSTDGQSVANAEVRGTPLGASFLCNAKSGDDGSFTLYAPEVSKSFRLHAENETNASEFQDSILTEKGLDGLTLVLDHPKTASISGVVVDGSDNAIGEVLVSLNGKNGNSLPYVAPCKTNENGEFTFANLAGGDYLISTTPAKNAPGYGDPDGHHRAHLESGENVTGLRILYGDKGGMSIAGRVVNGAGSPIASVMVICDTGATPAITRTDRDGKFVITGLEDKTYVVVARTPSLGSQSGGEFRAGTTDAEIVLKGQGTLSGRVVRDDTGEPLETFTLAYIVSDFDEFTHSLFGSGQPYSSADGTFSIDKIAADTITVAAWAPGFAPVRQQVKVDENTSAKIELRLKPVPPFEGSVVNQKGEAISGALVYFVTYPRMDSIESAAAAHSGADGRFVIDSFPENAKQVCAYHSGYGVGVAKLPGDHTIVLPGESSIEGTIQRDDPTQEVYVIVSHKDAPYIPAIGANVSPEGHYRITGLTPGPASICIGVDGGRNYQMFRAVLLKSDATLTENVTIARGTAQISGTLRSGGLPVKNASLELQRQTGDVREVLKEASSEDGLFQFDRVWAGDLVLRIIQHNNDPNLVRVHEVDIVTQDGQTLTQDIDLPSE